MVRAPLFKGETGMNNNNKPGLNFEAPVYKLCKIYNNIETIFMHMSMGQLSHHYVEDECIYHDKKGLIYNSKTGEINEV